MIEFDRVEHLVGELRAVQLRLAECRQKAREITEAVCSRILSDKRGADRRAEELTIEVNADSCSDTMRKIKQSEIDAIAKREYAPSEGEREVFLETIEEYKATFQDLKNKQIALTEAISDARHLLERIKSEAYKGADPVLTERDIDSQIKAFENTKISGGKTK